MKKILLATLLLIGYNLGIDTEKALAENQCDTYVVSDPNDTFVNVRTCPNGDVIAPIPNGITTTVIGENNGWYIVDFGRSWQNVVGYMYKPLLSKNTSCYALDVKDTTVDIHAEPAFNSRVLRTVLNGTSVECLDGMPSRKVLWVRVRFKESNGKYSIGYIFREQLGLPRCR